MAKPKLVPKSKVTLHKSSRRGRLIVASLLSLIFISFFVTFGGAYLIQPTESQFKDYIYHWLEEEYYEHQGVWNNRDHNYSKDRHARLNQMLRRLSKKISKNVKILGSPVSEHASEKASEGEALARNLRGVSPNDRNPKTKEVKTPGEKTIRKKFRRKWASCQKQTDGGIRFVPGFFFPRAVLTCVHYIVKSDGDYEYRYMPTFIGFWRAIFRFGDTSVLRPKQRSKNHEDYEWKYSIWAAISAKCGKWKEGFYDWILDDAKKLQNKNELRIH